ncbi:MAG: tripartite tricarboxylate transporter substrate binding protein [Betaproteobacteria bacterium]|nr:MAG: tripartite tricarboxylate transporter substrate binding protein [Betaproteobacteria bacterium]
MKVKSFASAAAVAFGLAAAAAAGPGSAQSFPAKPVRIIVAFPAGGGTDIVARVLGQKLTEYWGQQVLVDNRAGASGTIGTELAARAAPDGHTMFMGTMGNLTVNKHLFPKMAFDPIRDFTPLSQVVAVHFVMVAHPAVPAKTVKDVIALAKRQPGQITYGSSGPGGAPHLAGELLNSMAGIKLAHIPYKGSAITMQDLLGGQIMLSFDSLLQYLPQIRSGKIKAIGMLGKVRSSTLPDVPTISESGVPGYDLTNWFGLVLPAATPGELVRHIYADVQRALAVPEVRDKLTAMGSTVVGSPPEQFGAYMRAESEKWARVVKVAGIKPQ